MLRKREILQAGDMILMEATVVTDDGGCLTVRTQAGDVARINPDERYDVLTRALAPGDRVYREGDPSKRPATVMGTDGVWTWIRWEETDYTVVASGHLVRAPAGHRQKRTRSERASRRPAPVVAAARLE